MFARSISLIPAVVLLLACASVAHAQVTEDAVAQATVNLYCTIKYDDRTSSMSGSGVFINDRGVILTNAHVAQFFLLDGIEHNNVETDCSVRTGSPATEAYKVDVLYFPIEWIRENREALMHAQLRGTGEDDFALLYVTATTDGPLPDTFPALPFPPVLETAGNNSVIVAGYPSGDRDFDQIRDELAYLSGTSTVTNASTFAYTPQIPDVLTLTPSGAGNYGGSGGPVVNENGQVIALITGINANEDNPSIRAVTIPHISRALAMRTAFPLPTIVASNLSVRASLTDLFVTDKILDTVVAGFLERR